MTFLTFIAHIAELTKKLSANLKDIKLEIRGNLLRVVLSPRSCKLPDSLTCVVSEILFENLILYFNISNILQSLYTDTEGALRVTTEIEG